jgi:hypothetical protein
MDYYNPKNSFSLLSRLSIHADRNPYLLLLFFFVQASPLLTGSSTVASPPHTNSIFSHRNPILSLSPSISLWVTSFSPRSLSTSSPANPEEPIVGGSPDSPPVNPGEAIFGEVEGDFRWVFG